MKNLRKLIPALAMLVLSAVLMSTASFAWFSMRNTVTASGMTVTAQTNESFLVIAAGTSLPSGTTTDSANAQVASAQLFPTHPMTAWSSTNVSEIGDITKWGTATSSSVSDANTEASLTALASDTTYGNYVLKNSFMVGVATNSATPANDLRVGTVTITDNASMDGVTVVVVCGTNVYTYGETTTPTSVDKLADASAVTTAGVQVDIYVYIDGANSAVTTNNATSLGGSVVVTFTTAAATSTS